MEGNQKESRSRSHAWYLPILATQRLEARQAFVGKKPEPSGFGVCEGSGGVPDFMSRLLRSLVALKGPFAFSSFPVSSFLQGGRMPMNVTALVVGGTCIGPKSDSFVCVCCVECS